MARYFAVCLKMDDFGESERRYQKMLWGALGSSLWIPPNQYSIFEPTFEIERERFF